MEWRTSRTVAFTENDGPGRPPRGPSRAVGIGLAYAMVAVLVGMMSVDTLCPEHRAWVQGLGAGAFVAAVAAVVGLGRGWAFAPLLTVLAAGAGVAIGLLDAVHDPTRGRLLALAFAAVGLLAAFVAVRVALLARWDRSLEQELAGEHPDRTDHPMTRPGTLPEPALDEVAPAGRVSARVD